MEPITLNRFKVYRTYRWGRTEWLWTEANPYFAKYKLQVRERKELDVSLMKKNIKINVF